jgi:hypothetical protein
MSVILCAVCVAAVSWLFGTEWSVLATPFVGRFEVGEAETASSGAALRRYRRDVAASHLVHHVATLAAAFAVCAWFARRSEPSWAVWAVFAVYLLAARLEPIVDAALRLLKADRTPRALGEPSQRLTEKTPRIRGVFSTWWAR